MLKKAKKTRLKLEGNFLIVKPVLEPTHYKCILLINNLNPRTDEETLKDFIESTKNVVVLKVVFGKDGKAIVILENQIGG